MPVECAICMESLREATVTACGHSFCAACLRRHDQQPVRVVGRQGLGGDVVWREEAGYG